MQQLQDSLHETSQSFLGKIQEVFTLQILFATVLQTLQCYR